MFGRYGKLLAAILSGYLLAKLEPSASAIFADRALVQNPVYGIRFLSFLIGVILGAITMFVFRTYLFRDEPST